jgi:hypothetical protein
VISSYTTSTIIPNLSISTYGNPTGWGGGLAVNALQSKMLFLTNNMSGSSKLYYSTSSDQGTTWSAFTVVGTVSNAFSMAMSADGTRAIVSRNSLGVSFVNWSGATPVLSLFDNQTKNYTGCSMSNDGQYIVVSADSDTIYYSKWNGTTYDTMKSSGVTGAHWGVCISPLGDTIFYGNGMKCSTSTWTGSTATWTAGVATGVTTGNDYGYGFLGGIQTGAPNYILYDENNGTGTGLSLIKWNHATKTASNYTRLDSTVNGSNGIYALTNMSFPCTDITGQNIYYIQNTANSSTVFQINRIVFSVA